MSKNPVVVQSVWKKFQRGELHDSLRDLVPAVARRLVGRARTEDLGQGEFWALRDLSFTVEPGQALGIIGPNGAGKSTVLKLLSRILRPTRGEISMQGRVGALIELAAGFHPDLTGAENVYLQGSIMGMTKAEISSRFDDIVDFAGLNDFMEMPVKRYSSGMNARLGFAIAAHLEVDVLLVDEVLAVGDFDFQQKAFARLQEIVSRGIPVIVVSHQLQRVSELCSHAILLRKGEVAVRGTPAECIDAYVSPPPPASDGQRTGEATIRSAAVAPAGVVSSGDRVRVAVDVAAGERGMEERVTLWVQVRSLQTGEMVFATSTQSLGVNAPPAGDFRVAVSIQMNVPPGSYALECHLWDKVLMREVSMGPTNLVQVRSGNAFIGSVQMNATAELSAPV